LLALFVQFVIDCDRVSHVSSRFHLLQRVCFGSIIQQLNEISVSVVSSSSRSSSSSLSQFANCADPSPTWCFRQPSPASSELLVGAGAARHLIIFQFI
jgi:hypothetical protein